MPQSSALPIRTLNVLGSTISDHDHTLRIFKSQPVTTI